MAWKTRTGFDFLLFRSQICVSYISWLLVQGNFVEFFTPSTGWKEDPSEIAPDQGHINEHSYES